MTAVSRLHRLHYGEERRSVAALYQIVHYAEKRRSVAALYQIDKLRSWNLVR